MYEGQTFDFSLDGADFRATIESDECSDAPWDRDCGCLGLTRVSNGYQKRPSEVFVHKGGYRENSWICDVKYARRVARDIWGVAPADITRAVADNIERLRRWLTDDWCYIGVCVQALDDEDEPMGSKYRYALWGIESDSDEYIRDNVAPELARECLADQARSVYAGATVGA